jgi:hypothetical protein
MSSNRSAHDRLLALQKKIHRSLQQQATRLLGETPEAIRRYEREYREDFKRIPKRPHLAEKDELITEIRRCDVTLIGDYHTFSQAQRTALRILREAVQPGETWYLGLEMIPTHRQEALDRFQLGQLSEKHFLEEIEFEEEWGFPWRHYSPIIHWAIRNRVKLIALNRPAELKRSIPNETDADETAADRDHDELHERDRWAAGVITDIFVAARQAQIKRPRHHPRHHPRMLVLYGELHIGRKHLPQALKEVSSSALKHPLKTLILHQNQEALYWRLASQGRELEAHVVRLRERNYCVLSSPPWAKWQSVINWAEGTLPSRADPADTSNEDQDDHDELDPISLMIQYAGIVSEFFNLPQASFDGLDVYTIGNADFADNLERSKLSPLERRLIRYHVLHNHRIYLPGPSLAYLAAPSENGAAEIASIHLFHLAASNMQREGTSPERKREKIASTFYQWILDHSFGFLGSLILNPRRKCDLVDDHDQRVRELKKGAESSYPHELQARELTHLILSSPGGTDFQEALDEFLKDAKLLPALYFAARYVGFALAKHVHRSLLDETIELAELKRVYLGKAETALAPSFWRFHSLRSAALKNPVGTSKTESL